MEDPISFDVWANIRSASEMEAREILSRSRSKLPRIDLLKDISKKIHSGAEILIYEDVGWREASNHRVDLAAVFDSVRIYQCGFSSADAGNLSFCQLHELAFGGVIGCPICTNCYRL